MRKYGIWCVSTNSLCSILYGYEYEISNPHNKDSDDYFGTDDINLAFKCQNEFQEWFAIKTMSNTINYIVIEKSVHYGR